MGVFSRLFRLCKADLHGVMDQLEDKGLLLKQYLREMAFELDAKETQLEKISQTCRCLKNDLMRQEQMFQNLEKDLDLAICQEKDDIARVLIRKRCTLAMGQERLQLQLNTLKEEKDKISEKLMAQRLQYEQLKTETVAFFHQAERRRFEQDADSTQSPFAFQITTEEEIEMELLRRKETRKKGGV